MMIVARFGSVIIPWISITLGVMVVLGSFLNFQYIFYLIPHSICIALKNSVGILVAVNEIIRVFSSEDHPINVRAIDAVSYMLSHYTEAKTIDTFLYAGVTLGLLAGVKRFRNIPWFLLVSMIAFLVGLIAH